MSKSFHFLCASVCAFSMTALFADESFSSAEVQSLAFPEVSLVPAIQAPVETLVQEALQAPALQAAPIAAAPKIEKEVPFKPFTGKVKGRKVRMRLRPDLDSRIIKELNKNELVSIIGEKGDFWAVEAPAETKAYVFRSYVLDNVVEANHVNVRLEPSLEAPVIGHLDSGDRIEPVIAAANNKWYEIATPESTRFFISKDFVEYAGAPELKREMDKRHAAAEQLLDASVLLSKTELRKSFEEIDFDRTIGGFNLLIKDYAEFTEIADQAKEELASFQEAYLQTRIAHMDEHAAEEKFAAKPAKERSMDLHRISDQMKHWEPMEEALYLTWTNVNERKNLGEFYDEQKFNSETLTGIVEPYHSVVKGKPGDFIIRRNDIPVAYVYSTRVNLESLVGKEVKFVVSPRSNNNFAFPAYYVLDVE